MWFKGPMKWIKLRSAIVHIILQRVRPAQRDRLRRWLWVRQWYGLYWSVGPEHAYLHPSKTELQYALSGFHSRFRFFPKDK